MRLNPGTNMRKHAKFALIQMVPTENFSHDLATAEKFLARLKGKTDFAIFPEYFLGWKPHPTEILKTFKLLAKAHDMNIILGSFVESLERRRYNTCALIDRKGRLVGKYRKRHLYTPWEGHLKAGKSSKYYTINGVKIGIAICLDIYFPAEISKYRSADILIIPSMTEAREIENHISTVKTRAIENLIPMILVNAAGQTLLPVGNKTWGGKSCAVNPEGKILAQLDSRPGFKIVKIDLSEKSRVRKKLYDVFHLR